MKKYLLAFFICFIVNFNGYKTFQCGCKLLRPCYRLMLDKLQDRDEVPCVEDAAIGASTILIFLKALKLYCGDIINIVGDQFTYEGRNLYEVVIHSPHEEEAKDDSTPVIVIEAGQQGGTEPVGFALYIIEQLVACEEYEDMIDRAKWVILPCTNPDGMEYSRYNRVNWRKNLRPSDDKLGIGVDITRNFDSQWGSCDRVDSPFSPVYPGVSPASENETIFIKNTLNKHKKDIKAYVSIRRDGHSIAFPYGYTPNAPINLQLTKTAADIASKVNQRTGGVHQFINDSIHNMNGKPYCGHSVDYAYDLGISLVYELRVFLGSNNRMMSKFQTLPRGYESSLRNGYFSGIRELYNVITSDKKHNRIF